MRCNVLKIKISFQVFSCTNTCLEVLTNNSDLPIQRDDFVPLAPSFDLLPYRYRKQNSMRIIKLLSYRKSYTFYGKSK